MIRYKLTLILLPLIFLAGCESSNSYSQASPDLIAAQKLLTESQALDVERNRLNHQRNQLNDEAVQLLTVYETIKDKPEFQKRRY